ncbi:hypothetical protein [Methanohalophilus sp.]
MKCIISTFKQMQPANSPKPYLKTMQMISDRPIQDHVIETLKLNKINDIIFGFEKEKIMDYFKHLNAFEDTNVRYLNPVDWEPTHKLRSVLEMVAIHTGSATVH